MIIKSNNIQSLLIKFLILGLLLSGLDLLSQVKSYGVSGGFGYKFVTSNFNKLPTVPRPEVPLTYSSNPFLYDFNFFIEYGLFKKLNLGFEGGFSQTRFLFSDNENIKVIVNRVVYDATILHKMNMNISWLNPSLYLSYNIFQGFDLSAGGRFYIPLIKRYSQTQELILPGNASLINPSLNQSGKIPDIASPYIMTFIGVSYNSKSLQYKSLRFIPEIEYSIPMNSIIRNLDFSFSSAKFKLKVAFHPERKTKYFLFDTVYSRDTVINLVYEGKDRLTKFISRTVKSDDSGDDTVTTFTRINELYETLVPKPKAILNCELKAVFISDDRSETDKLNIVFNRNIRKFSIFGKKGSSFTIVKDTTQDIRIPMMKLIPSIISEAGIESWMIEIFNKERNLFTQSGKGDYPEKILVNLDSLIPNKENFSYNYVFQVLDKDGQKINCSEGTIRSFEKVKKTTDINNSYILIPKSFSDQLVSTAIKTAINNKKIPGLIYLIENSNPQLNTENFTIQNKKLDHTEYNNLLMNLKLNPDDYIILEYQD